MTKTIYRSKIDWWVWLVTVGSLAVIWLSAVDMSWWYVVFVCGSTTLLYAWLMFGCWYEIDGEDLVIYQPACQYPKSKTLRKLPAISQRPVCHTCEFR